MHLDNIKQWIPQIEKMSVNELDALNKGILVYAVMKQSNKNKLKFRIKTAEKAWHPITQI
jgi:hypothetical protein